jgi:hemoglobin/transferrin/lactoferrin receptor protein
MKNMKIYNLIRFLLTISAILLLNLNLSYSQTFTLKGKITDFKTGDPVEGAVIFISGNTRTYSNSSGDYTMKIGAAQGVEAEISHIGYRKLKVSLSAKSGEILKKDFSLEPSVIEFDEVLVSTGRNDTYLRNSPFSELVVGSTEIAAKPSQSLSDVLRQEPGISLMRDGIWGTEVSIRGLNRENVIALIDGSRIATSTDVAARLSMIDMNDIERVEIIKGASSSIYGSGATGGIVNIITRPPEFTDNLSLKGNLSSGFNSVNNLGVYSGSVYGGDSFWSAKLTGSYRKAGDIQTPAGEMKNSQFEDYSISGALDLIPFDKNLLKFGYQLFKANNVGIPGGSAVFPSIADIRYPDEKREMISAGYEISNISDIFYKLSVNYSFQDINRDVENIPHIIQNVPASGTSPAKRVSVLKITPDADHKNNNLQLQANFLLAEANNLAAGIDYWDRSYTGNRQKYELIQAFNPQGAVINTINEVIGDKPLPDSKYKSLGLFAQDEASLIKDKLSLSLGGRIDKIDVHGESTLTPEYTIVNGTINYSPAGQIQLWNTTDAHDISYSANTGLKYSLLANLDLTLSLGLSFRSPSLEERFQYIDQGSYVLVGNPDLKSEKGKSADLGIRYYLPDVKIVGSVFYNYFNDLVSQIPGQFEGRPAYINTNVGEARMYGFDFRGDYNIYGSMVIYTSASYVKGDNISTGGNLSLIPALNGTFGIKFGLPSNFQADYSIILFAPQNDIGSGEIATPGYGVSNFALNSRPIRLSGCSLQIFAGIDNIFDKGYRDHLSTLRGGMTIEPGRNFFIKLAFAL